nr:hypothetical protein Iba_chr14bCG10520 [Ipomoea batatas]
MDSAASSELSSPSDDSSVDVLHDELGSRRADEQGLSSSLGTSASNGDVLPPCSSQRAERNAHRRLQLCGSRTSMRQFPGPHLLLPGEPVTGGKPLLAAARNEGTKQPRTPASATAEQSCGISKWRSTLADTSPPPPSSVGPKWGSNSLRIISSQVGISSKNSSCAICLAQFSISIDLQRLSISGDRQCFGFLFVSCTINTFLGFNHIFHLFCIGRYSSVDVLHDELGSRRGKRFLKGNKGTRVLGPDGSGSFLCCLFESARVKGNTSSSHCNHIV